MPGSRRPVVAGRRVSCVDRPAGAAHRRLRVFLTETIRRSRPPTSLVARARIAVRQVWVKSSRRLSDDASASDGQTAHAFFTYDPEILR